LLKGILPSHDRILIALIVSLASMYEEHKERLVSYYGQIIGNMFEGFVNALIALDGFNLWLDLRTIREGKTEEERKLIKKYGVLEIDVYGYRTSDNTLIVGECKFRKRKATRKDLEEFLEKSVPFIERVTFGRRKDIKVKRIYISIYGFTKDCNKIKNVELIDKEKLNKWAKKHGFKRILIPE